MAGTSCLHVALDGRNRRKGRFVDIDHNRELTWWLQLATPWALPKIYITFHLPGFKSSILRNDGAENCWTLQPLWMQAQWIRLRIRKSERKASIGNPLGNRLGNRELCPIFPYFSNSARLCQAILDKIARKNTSFTQEITALRQRLRNFPEGNASCVDRILKSASESSSTSAGKWEICDLCKQHVVGRYYT